MLEQQQTSPLCVAGKQRRISRQNKLLGTKESLKTFSETPEANSALLFIHCSACKSGHLCFTFFSSFIWERDFWIPDPSGTSVPPGHSYLHGCLQLHSTLAALLRLCSASYTNKLLSFQQSQAQRTLRRGARQLSQTTRALRAWLESNGSEQHKQAATLLRPRSFCANSCATWRTALLLKGKHTPKVCWLLGHILR